MDNFKKTNSSSRQQGTNVYRYSSLADKSTSQAPVPGDNFDPSSIPTIELDNQANKSQKSGESFGSKMKKFFKNKKVLIVLIILFIILAVLGFIYFKNKNKPVATSTEQVIVEKKEVKKIISPLTGK